MSKYKSGHRYPVNHTPLHRAPSRIVEFARRHPRKVRDSIAVLVMGAIATTGANEMRNFQQESYPVSSDRCHILSLEDTGEQREQVLPDGSTVTVDRVVVEPYLELTPETERRFNAEGDKHSVSARQILPGGAEVGQVGGYYQAGGQHGRGEVVLEPPVSSRSGALMEFTVGDIPCTDGLVLSEGRWQFAGPIDQYEPRLQQGIQSAP